MVESEQPAFLGYCYPTCIYSIGLSSPISRFAITLLAGKAFGVILRIIRRRELVMTREVIETIHQNQLRNPYFWGLLIRTSILVFQMESRSILWSTSNVSHNVVVIGGIRAAQIKWPDDLN